MIEKQGKVRQSDILAINWQHFGAQDLNKMIETLIAAKKIRRTISGEDIWFEAYKDKFV